METAIRVVQRLDHCEETMKILWYYNRLKAMELGEIMWRIRRLAWQICARFARRWWAAKYQKMSDDSTRIVEMIEKVNFWGLSSIRPRNISQKWTDGTIAAAEKLLQNQYELFARSDIYLAEKIKWNHEYKRDIDIPLQFGPWMDYRDTESYGDFKYFWELPRLQHLITLAKAYYLSGKQEYAEKVAKHIEGFTRQSPYLLGVNWTMPMEAAIRLISVSWTTAFLKDYLKSAPETCSLIEQIVRSHVNYVVKNYAAYSSANNHLVAEAAGVFIAGICFSHLEKMNTYREKAYDILCKEIIAQHYDDGVNKEQAVHYQILSFNFFLLAALLAKANGIEFPAQYWGMLEKIANFIAAIADQDCRVPHIGDSDDSRAILLTDVSTNEVAALLATSSVLFKRSDLKKKAKCLSESSLWILGERSQEQFDALNEQVISAPVANHFEQGGYHILKGGNKTDAKLIFDCGPLGFGPISAHGHADSLSFVLNVYGLQYFIDTGTYTYVADSPFRNYFRSTAAHNTVVVDGQDQSKIAGPFLWGHKANSYLEQWTSDAHYDRIAGWHDGYLRLPDPVTHRRSIEINKEKETIEVIDILEARASHNIAICFHLAPQCWLNASEKKQWHITNNNRTIILVTDNNLDCKRIRSGNEPIGGWASSAYDRKEPIDTLICHGVFTGNQNFTTRINMIFR